MMMGFGLLFMVLIGLIVIGVPLLIVAMIVGGRLTALFKSGPRQAETNPPASSPKPSAERKCATCGRVVSQDWNVCPSCGAALT